MVRDSFKNRTSNLRLYYELWSERASERERSGACEQSVQCKPSKRVSGESVRANERTKERMAQCLQSDFWLYQTTVEKRGKGKEHNEERKRQESECARKK